MMVKFLLFGPKKKKKILQLIIIPGGIESPAACDGGCAPERPTARRMREIGLG